MFRIAESSYASSARNLWDERASLPSLGTAGSVLLLILISALAGLSVFSGLAGLFIICATAGAQAALFVLCRKWYTLASLPGAYLIALALIRDPLTALSAVSFMPVAAVIAAAVYMKLECAPAVGLTAASLGVVEAAAVAVEIAASGMGASEWFAELRRSFVLMLTAATVNTEAGPTQLLTEEVADAVVTGFVNIAPAVVVILLLMAAAVACKTFFAMSVFMRAKIFKTPWLIESDVPTAVIFTIFWLASTLFSFIRDAEAAYYAAENVALIFAAPLIAVGLRVIYGRLSRPYTFFARFFRAAITVMCFIVATNLTVSITAMVGVWHTMRKSYKAKNPDGEE